MIIIVIVMTIAIIIMVIMWVKTFLAQILGWATGGPPSMGNTKNSPLQVTMEQYIIIIIISIFISIIILMVMIIVMMIFTGSRQHCACSRRCS